MKCLYCGKNYNDVCINPKTKQQFLTCEYHRGKYNSEKIQKELHEIENTYNIRKNEQYKNELIYQFGYFNR